MDTSTLIAIIVVIGQIVIGTNSEWLKDNYPIIYKVLKRGTIALIAIGGLVLSIGSIIGSIYLIIRVVTGQENILTTSLFLIILLYPLSLITFALYHKKIWFRKIVLNPTNKLIRFYQKIMNGK